MTEQVHPLSQRVADQRNPLAAYQLQRLVDDRQWRAWFGSPHTVEII
jgi:hypothetical protein